MGIIKKRDIHIANYLTENDDDSGNTIKVYDEPFGLKCTLNSLSGDTEFQMFGDRIQNMVKTILDYNWMKKIHEKDAAYLYGATPKGEVIHGENANYRVVSVRPQNLKIIVYFEKLP